MDKPKGKKGIIRFLSTGIWELDPEQLRGVKRHWIRFLQILVLVAKDFWADQCLLQASALSFTTILSLVPFFALTFAILKGLGVQNLLEPFILEQVSAGSEAIVQNVITYINNTNMTSLGAAGLLTLLVTVVTLMGNIEESFNLIWGVKQTRNLYRKFSDYLSALVIAPLLMLAAVSLSSTLESKTVVQWVVMNTYLGDALLYAIRFVQQLSLWGALVFLYVFIPNTKVHLKSALIGGVLAGGMWQLVQWGYIHFQVGVAKYNAIYGTLAVLPIFMVWIYVSWLIVLLGGEIVYAHQNIKTFRKEIRTSVSHSFRELLALSILKHMTDSFRRGTQPWALEALSERLDVPVRLVRELAETLAAEGFITRVSGDSEAYLPLRDMGTVTVVSVLKALKHHGSAPEAVTMYRGEKELISLLATAEAGKSSALEGITVQDLAAREEHTTGNPAD